jgi:hypothetical protein
VLKEKIAEILFEQKWIFAKTMPQSPHEYCLRKNFNNDSDFVCVVKFIRENGKEEAFGRRKYTYLYFNGYKYWTMGEEINKPDGSPHTILINRAKDF